MHRKATGILLIAGAAAALLLGLIVIGIITGPAKGKVEEYGKAFDDAAAEIGDWGCTAIKDPVDFKTFMEKMKEIYENCNKDDTMCGAKSCKKMTLKLKGGAGTYYTINPEVLKSWSLDMFNNYYMGISAGPLAPYERTGANIFCEADNEDGNDYEIDAFYSGGNYERQGSSPVSSISVSSKEICHSYSIWKEGRKSSFAVADGSKVTVVAKKPKEFWGEAVDLKIKIDGGTFADGKGKLAPINQCNDDKECGTAWAECKEQKESGNKLCDYNYCGKHPDKCTAITLSCTLDTDCEDATTHAKAPEYSCPNGFKTKINKLTQDKTGEKPVDIVSLSVIYAGNSIDAGIEKGKEQWFGRDVSEMGVYPARTAANDPDAKLSVAVTEIKHDPKTSKYEVKLLQGCY